MSRASVNRREEDCACGKRSSHGIWKNGKNFYQCCECYIKDGNPPADWHDDCMKAYRDLKQSAPT